MTRDVLDRVAREASGRIVAALAARFRDLDLAEDAFSDACARAAEAWPRDGVPNHPAAWLYEVARRRALDEMRRRAVRNRIRPDAPPPEPTAEDVMSDDARLIPDERLRLIFICCHPAVAPEARAALTLRLVCGLSVAEIARAFLVAEPTLAQRLVRAKRKIADAGVPYEVPGPEAWPDRIDAVLSTLEVAYAKAHEDAAGAGAHAGYAAEMLELTRVLACLIPNEAEALALAALVRYAEARRPARLDDQGAMVPLSEQDPRVWRRPLIEEADRHLDRALALGPAAPRTIQAAIHAAWCRRRSLAEPAPWPEVLALYDLLLTRRDDPIVRLNRAVALAEIAGVPAALHELELLDAPALASFLPYHAARADLLRRTGRAEDARAAYAAALALDPPTAERMWLERRMRSVGTP
jgi:RNA polymerase sigma-70 factor, ECF subfamily